LVTPIEFAAASYEPRLRGVKQPIPMSNRLRAAPVSFGVARFIAGALR
jgi:hypothetical protein